MPKNHRGGFSWILYRSHIPGIEVNGKVIPPFVNTDSLLSKKADISLQETGKVCRTSKGKLNLVNIKGCPQIWLFEK